jgi:hypothetical protein
MKKLWFKQVISTKIKENINIYKHNVLNDNI